MALQRDHDVLHAAVHLHPGQPVARRRGAPGHELRARGESHEVVEAAGGTAPTYTPIALFRAAPVCCFAPTYYCDAGCELKDSNPWLWACLATGVVCFAVNYYFTHVLCDYEETERLEKACELRRRYARGSPNQYLKDYETTGPDGDGLRRSGRLGCWGKAIHSMGQAMNKPTKAGHSF